MRCMTTANKVGVPFSYFVRPKSGTADFRIVTDASMLVGAGGIVSDGTFFQTRWADLDMHIQRREERDIQWRELVAIYAALLGLEQRHGDRLNDCRVQIFTDNVACKYMLINMTAKLGRPDLQVLINEICELCINRRVHLWMEHIPGDDNKVADALSRFFPNPLKFEQKTEYSVGPLNSDQSSAIHKLLQRGADLSAEHVAEGSFTISTKNQEFPTDYIKSDN